MTTLAAAPKPTMCRVRVWFGEHVIAEYIAEPALAMQYQAGMTRRFASLRVTAEPTTAVPKRSASGS